MSENGGMDCITKEKMKSNMKSMMGKKDMGFFGHMDVNNVMKKSSKIQMKEKDMSQYDDLGYMTRAKRKK